ncbi:MAG: hypothetical protein UX81_C0008G0022 [Parcubacteria group bacterium GW2011_GWA2_47_12]|nr:MAG: hypothetical protein UX81_C0008G0022 [Parcubacteria group bacterium GW2011_GWA2_47_12]
MNNLRKRLAFALAIIVFAGLASYGVYQSREYLHGPSISIESAEQNGALISITGNAKRIAFLSLNGKQIFTDENGLWQETVLLLPGYNSMTVAARDRFGRTNEKYLDAYRAPDTI